MKSAVHRTGIGQKRQAKRVSEKTNSFEVEYLGICFHNFIFGIANLFYGTGGSILYRAGVKYFRR